MWKTSKRVIKTIKTHAYYYQNKEQRYDTMRLLCFDVGVKNLSYIDIDVRENESDPCIRRWGVIDITRGRGTPKEAMRNVDVVITMMLHALHDPEEEGGGGFVQLRSHTSHTSVQEDIPDEDQPCYDYVLIENQPVIKNPTMKTLQIALCTYFQTMKMLAPMFGPKVGAVRFVSAGSKLGAEGKGLTYAERKKQGVVMCRTLLDTVTCPAHVVDAFERSKKKDDLADTFLLALAFLQNRLSPSGGGLKKEFR